MARVFISGEGRVGALVTLDRSEAHYIRDVLRKRGGDDVGVVDSGGTEYAGRVEVVTSEEVSVVLLEVLEREVEPRTRLHLLQGWPKGSKLDAIVEQATELGVATVTPVFCRRSVPRPGPAQEARRQARWERVAVAAARQSGRRVIPRIESAVGFPQALEAASRADRALLFAETAEGATDLRRALSDGAPLSSVALLVGPEGGWAEEELAAARERGITRVNLGPRVLRAETAAIVACALCLYELGELRAAGEEPPEG